MHLNERSLHQRAGKRIASRHLVHVCQYWLALMQLVKMSPPFIIFGKRFPGGPYTKEGTANALYGTLPSGYIDNELFRGWFGNNFIKYAVKTCPLLLVFNGNKSHLDPEVIEAARK